jgi:hypothetical protein
MQRESKTGEERGPRNEGKIEVDMEVWRQWFWATGNQFSCCPPMFDPQVTSCGRIPCTGTAAACACGHAFIGYTVQEVRDLQSFF